MKELLAVLAITFASFYAYAASVVVVDSWGDAEAAIGCRYYADNLETFSSVNSGGDPDSIVLVLTPDENPVARAVVHYSSDVFVISYSCSDKSLELSWRIPDKREDGKDLEAYEIGSYVISYRPLGVDAESGEMFVITDPLQTTYVIDGVEFGAEISLSIKTVDTNNLSSAWSPTISLTAN